MNKIMFFTSPTCSRCRVLKKMIESMGETETFDLIDIETDRGEVLVETYCVTSLPTLIMVKDDKVYKKVETVVLPNVLKEMIAEYHKTEV